MNPSDRRYKEIENQIVQEYRANNTKSSFSAKKQKFDYLHKKLSHIKKLVSDFDSRIIGQGEVSEPLTKHVAYWRLVLEKLFRMTVIKCFRCTDYIWMPKKTDLELIGLLNTHSITQFDKTRIETDGNLVVLRIVSPDMNDLHIKKPLRQQTGEEEKFLWMISISSIWTEKKTRSKKC